MRRELYYALSSDPKKNIVRCPYAPSPKVGSKTQCPKFDQ